MEAMASMPSLKIGTPIFKCVYYNTVQKRYASFEPEGAAVVSAI